MRERELSIAPNVDAAAAARDAVVDAGEDLAPGTVEDLRLLVSEIVTNSVRHADLGATDRITMRFGLSRARVRVEVTDRGPGFDPPSPLAAARDGEGGWGLILVDRIADRWGVERGEDTLVWFELDLAPGGARPSGR